MDKETPFWIGMKISRLASSIGAIFILLAITGVTAQDNGHMKTSAPITRIANDFPISSLDSGYWDKVKDIVVKNYWSGKSAPNGRHFKARLLWSDTALYVRFEANQKEPLTINQNPDLSKKTKGLWDRDVCEIFVAPDRTEPNKYFEFEIAPTGEWIDLGIEVVHAARLTDWGYASGMHSFAKIDDNKITMVIKIPWKAFGNTPKDGDIWPGNLFRCVGKGPTRGYLAWQATRTPTPNFHVPTAFGEFHFEE